MQLLKDRIRKDGVIKDGNVLKVDSFLNHQMDIALINEMGKEFRRRFPDESINKILTIEASGIGIAGIVAGMKTEKNYIGYVAAKGIPEVIRGINAFTLGVQSVNPDAKVEVVFTDTWYDPSVEKQAALELLNKGVDVIAQHQDTTAPQVAAQEKGAYCIGYNFPTADAAPDAYLTAACFNWATFYTDDCQRALDGTWTSRAYWEGLAANMTYLDDLTALCAEGTQEKVDAARDSIIDGSFDPFTGPLYDQNGELKVEEGVKMTDDEIWNMNWFVQGVVGSIPA